MGGRTRERELTRFRIEAEAVARLQHPNIVQIHDVGEHNGLPYFSLEFCSGGTLADQLNGTPLKPEKVASLVEQLARAMQAAHESNVIHRDLKPANVLLANDGAPKITDFGLAKKLDEVGQTQSGAIMGSPSYMAPEQAAGKTKKVGPSCDVYGLGVILYECLTGRPPFKAATTVDTLWQVVSRDAVSPRSLLPNLSVDLNTICMKCLHKDPTRRYASAGELADDLRRFLNGKPVVARPVGRVEKLWRWCGRNPALATSLAAAMFALFAGVIVSTYFGINATWKAQEARLAQKKAEDFAAAEKQARKDTEDERKRTELQRRRAEKQRDLAEIHAYTAKLMQARDDYERRDGRLGLRVLNSSQWDLRGWEHDHLWTRVSSKQTLRGHAGPVNDACYSPDGRRILSGSDDKTLKMWDAATGKEIRTLAGHAGAVKSVCFSPDGKQILSGGADKVLKVWDAETGNEVQTLTGHGGVVTGVCFHPDGNRVVSASSDKTVKVWNLKTGQVIFTLKGLGAVHSVCLSPDGKRIASGGGKLTGVYGGQIKVWDTDTGMILLSIPQRDLCARCVSFSPDGKQIVTCGGVFNTVSRHYSWNGIFRYDALTGRPAGANVHTMHRSAIHSARFSPDGQRVLSGSMDNTVVLSDSRTRKAIFTFKGHSSPVNVVNFSPDGTRILSGSSDSTVKTWDAAKKQAVMTLTHPGNLQLRSSWYSPDGKRVLTCGIQGPKLYDAETGRLIQSFEWTAWLSQLCAFSPNGKHFVSSAQSSIFRSRFTAGVWDVETARRVMTLKDNKERIDCILFSRDGRMVVTGAQDRIIRFWDAVTGKELFSLEGHTSGVKCIHFSADGKLLISGSGDSETAKSGEVKLWNVAQRKVIRTLKSRTFPVSAVSFSPNNRCIVFGDVDGSLTFQDLKTEKEFVIPTFAGNVRSVRYSPDGLRLYSGHSDSTVRVWDAENGHLLFILEGHDDRVECVDVSPDGRSIMSCSNDNSVRIWNAQRSQRELVLSGHKQEVRCVCISPDNERIASGGQDNTVRVWDAVKGSELFACTEHTECVRGVTFNPDSTRIASASDDGTVKLWDAGIGEVIHTYAGHSGAVNSVCFSPDGKRIVSGSADDTMKVWNVAGGKALMTLKGHTDAITSVCFSPDGKFLVSGSADRNVKIWNATNGKTVLTLTEHASSVTNVCFSPDGKRLLSSSTDSSIKLWDFLTGRALVSFQGHSGKVNVAAFHPDGKIVVSAGSDNMVKIWDTETGREIMTLVRYPTAINALAFRENGKQIVYGGEDGFVRVWKGQMGQQIHTLKGHIYPVTKAAFSRDGKRIFAWDNRNNVKAWSAPDYKPIDLPNPSAVPKDAPAYSPAGYLRAEPLGRNVAVIDVRLPKYPNTWSLPDADTRKLYHTEQAQIAEKNKQGFAVLFHLDRLLLDDPDNVGLQLDREEALQQFFGGKRDRSFPNDSR